MRIHTGTDSEPRSGFTLLELIVVIVIISVLVGLLLTVFGGVFTNVDVTRVKAEFSQLETALTSGFRAEYGVYPPSKIVLTEDPGTTAWDATSKSFLRKMFGANVDFSAVVDFNNDGDTSDVLTLTSSECLVFFVGGMPDGPDGKSLTGFSRNAEKPFARGGENRAGPWFNLDIARLVDNDGDGMAEYKDAASGDDQSVAILYASSNNGQGYTDLNGSVNHYHQSDGHLAWNNDTFQLISPGADGDFGFDVEPNPFPPEATRLKWSPGAELPLPQRDNITNFAPGTLGN